MTLSDAVGRATRALMDAGIEGAARDARMLVAAACGRPQVDLIAHADSALGTNAASRLGCTVARRAGREPVSRILGEREFYGRGFRLTPATLDPRPDTETLIDAALQVLAEDGSTSEPLRILDIGTGSGCLIVTLLAELPRAEGLATDICPSALAVALCNAERHGVAGRLRLRRADALEDIDGRYNLIVSNPPTFRATSSRGLMKRCADTIRMGRSMEVPAALKYTDALLGGLVRSWSAKRIRDGHCSK